MIEIKGIKKSFGSLEVLKGIDLTINKGEIVSIVGPSGAGKTTLLQIIGTLDRPDNGSVCVDGIDTSKLSTKKLSDFRNQHIGFVFQFHQLLPEFTALENIMIPAYIAGTSQKAARKRAEELLQFMGLADRAHHKPNELSGGEKQRVAVARALVNNPAVILADEPSGSLDSKNKAELHQLFFDLREKYGQTFVIVTHDEGLANITDRTIKMRDGMLEQSVVGDSVSDATLEFSTLGSTREGNDVADVLHTCYKQNQTLEAKTEASMRTGSPTTGIDVPPQVGLIHLTTLNLTHQFVVALLTHRTTDDLTDLREQHVGTLHGRTRSHSTLVTHRTAIGRILVLFHIERLESTGVVSHDDGLLEVLLHEVALMLTGQVVAPVTGELKLLTILNSLLQDIDTLSVRQTNKGILQNTLQTFNQGLVDHLV